MSEYIVDTFGIVQDFADLHGDMNMPLYQAIMDVMVSRQREEIVRCRDCKYSAHFFHHDDERWQCTNPNQDGDGVKPDAYCWRGKRKESGE